MIPVLIIALIVFALILLSGHPYRIISKVKSDSYYYNVFKTEVRYVPMGNWFELGNRKINGIDLKTVEVQERKYIKDKYSVYFEDTRITNADPGSFVAIDNFYAKDKNTVYYCSHSFQDIDVDSFEFVKDDHIVLKDKKHSYSIIFGDYGTYSTKGTTIPFLPECIVFLDAKYSKDNELVYYKGQVIKGADAKTVVLVYDGYAKDNNNVYYDGNLLVGADPKTFVSIDNYTKDINKVYYWGKEVKGIDATSFAVIDKSLYTKDAFGVYYYLKGVYDFNGLATHYTVTRIEDADPLTFEAINDPAFRIDAKDKQKGYFRGQVKKML